MIKDASAEDDDVSMPNTPKQTENNEARNLLRVPSNNYTQVSTFHSTVTSVRLLYADFLPKFITINSIEPFDSLLARVNDWLEECESNVKVERKVKATF